MNACRAWSIAYGLDLTIATAIGYYAGWISGITIGFAIGAYILIQSRKLYAVMNEMWEELETWK